MSDPDPTQASVENLVGEINAKELRIPWLAHRRLVIALSPDPRAQGASSPTPS